jgi:phenylalanyl-tRNA synthetase beta chain
MPGTTIYASDLLSMIGRPLDDDELRSTLLGCKTEIESRENDELKLEVKDSNRIALLSTEGIARTVRGHLGIETGLPRYSARPSGIDLTVDPLVRDVRPSIVACTARGVRLTDEILISYMNLQEKIHATYGRGRKRMAIGFYDLDLIHPPVTYTVTSPDDNAFVPLGFEEPMTPRQILEDHPKGRDYAPLLEGFKRYPLLVDSENQVLSMPPVINSNTLGKISAETRNLFVEATGSEFGALSMGLNVLATALADRGGRIGSIKLDYGPSDIRWTPDFTTHTRELKPENCNRLLGLSLTKARMVDLLRRARFGARPSRGRIQVRVPPYRSDIMHETDLIEEVAMMYGYENFEPIDPRIPTVGRTDELEDLSDSLRDLMIGLGFQEIMTFVLTSPENVSTRMGGREVGYVEIENPSTHTLSIFRPDLLPSLMEFLGDNAHVSYPQRIYEAGDVVELGGGQCRTLRKLCFAWADSRVNFTQMKGVVESLLSSTGKEGRMQATSSPAFIEGRAASVLLDGGEIGIFGEIHPEVLSAWQIPVPVLAAELEVAALGGEPGR